MNYSFEYIDIILLAMIAGFIFLRLRGILGKKTGYEEDIHSSFTNDFPLKKNEKNINNLTFGEKEKNEFLKGAKVAYETIITNFATGNLKDIKYLLNKKIFKQFEEAINDRKKKIFHQKLHLLGLIQQTLKNMLKIKIC